MEKPNETTTFSQRQLRDLEHRLNERLRYWKKQRTNADYNIEFIEMQLTMHKALRQTMPESIEIEKPKLPNEGPTTPIKFNA